jgi:hypothetical protein
MNNAAANQKGQTSGEKQPIKVPAGKETMVGVAVKSDDKFKFAVPRKSLRVITKPAIFGEATTVAGSKQKQGVPKTISPTSAPSAAKKMLISAQQNTSTTTVSSSATPPAKKTTPKSVAPLSLVATTSESSSKSPSDESLQLGEAFTLSPSHQAKILSHTSQVHKTGAQSTAKRGAVSSKASVTSKKKGHRPPHTLYTLTIPQLHTEIKSVSTKWRKLGHGLNQNISNIEAENGNNPEQCLLSLLKNWHTLATGGKVSSISLWMCLLKTLRRDVMGEKVLADSLQEKYGVNVMIRPGMYDVVCSCMKISRPERVYESCVKWFS